MKLKCNVCGKRFSVAKADVYQVTDTMTAFEAFTKAMNTYDAIDCPRCGCQQKLANRLPALKGREIEDEDEDKT